MMTRCWSSALQSRVGTRSRCFSITALIRTCSPSISGYVVVRPVDANRASSGELILRLLVRPVVDEPRPQVRRQGRDAGLVLGDDVRPAVRQRFAAYAVVTSSRGLLATEYSGRTAVTGRWGMPGGGLDDHEPPTSAVLREVAEETSQEIILGELIKVQTSHWVGRSPYGMHRGFPRRTPDLSRKLPASHRTNRA